MVFFKTGKVRVLPLQNNTNSLKNEILTKAEKVIYIFIKECQGLAEYSIYTLALPQFTPLCLLGEDAEEKD